MQMSHLKWRMARISQRRTVPFDVAMLLFVTSIDNLDAIWIVYNVNFVNARSHCVAAN